MIIDTSAIVAILRQEPEARRFAEVIAAAAVRRISAANYVEIGAVIDGGRDPVASRLVDQMLAPASIVIEAVTEMQARVAREAYRDFGKGSGHAAGLNVGDCFAQARSMLSVVGAGERRPKGISEGASIRGTDLAYPLGALADSDATSRRRDPSRAHRPTSRGTPWPIGA